MSTFSEKCPAHLYVHWPFCSKKCHYCDFVAFEQHSSYQDAYHQTLCGEVSSFSSMIHSTDKKIDTIFFGGGTPSLYPLDSLKEFWGVLNNSFDLSALQEASLEVNPADVDEEKLDTWLECGFNRLSIGVQALDDDLLLKLNRRQRILDVHNTMKIAPKYFKRMSVDLILGLPGISEAAWKRTLQEAVSWPIQHISIYFLTIHEKTPLYFKVQRGDILLPDDGNVVGMYDFTIDFLLQHNFAQYEISNFAKPGFESTHNQAYWERKPYKGFGIGSSSFDGKNRFVNDSNLERYIAAYEKPAHHMFATQESLTAEQELLEKLMLGLRQPKGVGLHSVVYLLGDEKKELFLNQVNKLKSASLLAEKDGKIFLTRKGMIFENEVVVGLI